MATVQRVLQGSGKDKVVVVHTTITDADVTDFVLYDNSAFINDVTTHSRLMSVMISGSDALVNLEWDQTTDSPIKAFNPINSPKEKYCAFGGITNPRGAGTTGDLIVTTTGMATGEIVTIIIWVEQF